MFLGVFTGRRDFLQPPVEMTQDLRDIAENPALQQMLKYTFAGSKETVKKQTVAFLEQTRADELMVVTNLYDHNDRVKSYEKFAEIMSEIQADKAIAPAR